MPKRIQRMRSKGWRMPENAVYVGRPTKWGNPFRVGFDGCGCRSVGECIHFRCATVAEAVETFRAWAERWNNPRGLLGKIAELRGKDLACWCPLDQPCHADVLLEIANR
jgi:hypothetical protein